MTTAKRRCMTCHRELDAGDPAVHAPLAHFEEWCICGDCVDIYRKRKSPEKTDEH
jgi:hypothetical protein